MDMARSPRLQAQLDQQAAHFTASVFLIGGYFLTM